MNVQLVLSSDQRLQLVLLAESGNERVTSLLASVAILSHVFLGFNWWSQWPR